MTLEAHLPYKRKIGIYEAAFGIRWFDDQIREASVTSGRAEEQGLYVGLRLDGRVRSSGVVSSTSIISSIQSTDLSGLKFAIPYAPHYNPFVSRW